ncbi:MAG: tRNA glutamyl-Q(34) synthetase GluQRS [Thiohalocapsa sp.]
MSGFEPSDTPRGRFAPSPTGPLHFGSLIAAVGSFADARSRDGVWLVRMEDLDRAREIPGAACGILQTLERFGMEWDESVIYQSHRTDAYEQALGKLRQCGLTFPCACSRREIAALGRPGPEGPVYPGTCRRGITTQRQARSERLRVGMARIDINDRIHGAISQDLMAEVGDFVLHRADGIFAYQLAVVVDDAIQGVNSIVRGADLLLSTPRQVYLQRLLGLPLPTYAHLPLIVDHQGRKLSKSLAAAPVDPTDPVPCLLRAWRLLGQAPMHEPPGSVTEFWRAALSDWCIERVPHCLELPLPSG